MSGGMNILLSLDWQNGVRKLPQRVCVTFINVYKCKNIKLYMIQSVILSCGRSCFQQDLWLGNMLLCPAIRNTLAPSPLVLFLLRCLCVPCCPSASPSFLPSTHKYRDAAVAASMLSDENRWHGYINIWRTYYKYKLVIEIMSNIHD